MTDIVEQLRKEAAWEGLKVCKEAADEIERLRSILAKIKRDVEQAQYPEELGMDWLDDINDVFQPEAE